MQRFGEPYLHWKYHEIYTFDVHLQVQIFVIYRLQNQRTEKPLIICINISMWKPAEIFYDQFLFISNTFWHFYLFC